LHLSPRGRLSNGPGRGGPIYRSVPARCMAGRWPCSSSHKLVRREIAEARMRTIREGVNRLDLAGLSCQPERSGRDMEKLRGLTEVQPRFDSVIGGFVDGNAVMRAQRGDTLTGPAIAMACHQTVPVQDAGDEIVIGNQHQLSNCGNHMDGGAVALPTPPSGQAYLAVNAADPMDHQNNLGRLRIDISDHFMDNGADDTLLQPCISRGGGPDSLEVRSERGERCRIGDGSDL